MNKGYAICLNEWLDDDRISGELNLLLRISSLTAEKGFCFASNDFFAEKLKMTTVNVSRKISKLKKLGYIEIEAEKRGCQIIKREIRLTKMLTHGYQKCYSTVNKNVKDNNTSINNNKNISKDISKDEQEIKTNSSSSLNGSSLKKEKENFAKEKESSEFKEIFDYFNKKASSRLKPTNGKRKQLNTRLKLFTMDEIKKAIDNWTTNEWIQENNFKGRWDSLFRSDDQLEKWVNQVNKSSQPPQPKYKKV